MKLNTDNADMRMLLKEEEARRLKEEAVVEDTPWGVIAEGEEKEIDDTVLGNPLVTGSQDDNELDKEMEGRPSEPVAAGSNPQDHMQQQEEKEEKEEEKKEKEEEVRETLKQNSSDA